MKNFSPFVPFAALALTALTANSSFAQCPDPIEYCSTSPNSVGTGALMSWTGTPSIVADDFHLVMTGAPANQFMVFYYGAAQLSLPFGDGLRCAGGGVIRLEVRFANSGNGFTTSTTISIATKGGVSAGQTRRYQFWYRDSGTSPCNSLFNLSNGYELTWGV